MPAATWQPSLLGSSDEPRCDPTFEGASRRFLGAGAWLDVVPGWVRGADELFERVLAAGKWSTRDRRMYDKVVTEPRLTTGRIKNPPPPCDEIVSALTDRYGLDLSAVSANLYRDGADSVAWHGDTLGRRREQTVVAILSLGAPRRFLLRPKGGGGSSIRLTPSNGDLLVMGGSCQRTWDHSVPKCAAAGSRISVMFREPGVY